ncbi:MAG: LysR family transcriptional regulator [Clostridia bacterium]|nr:LysR family transcriptional regulator [Clostridia bacterium]
MNLKQVEYFVELVKEANFTRAANKLYICQSALSKAIKQLETELNTKLIDRSVYRFKLTPEGEIFYQNGKKALENINSEISKLKDSINLMQGKVAVGIPPVLGTMYFSSVIYRYRNLYPDVDLRIEEVGANTVKDMIDSGQVDIGVVILPFRHKGFQIYPAVSAENILLVGKDHPFANRDYVSISELENEKFIMLDKTFTIHDRILEACRNFGFEPSIGFESSQWDFVVEMVAQNQGVTILPPKIFSRFPSSNVRLIKLAEPFPWEIAFIAKEDKYLSRPMKQFIDLAKEINQ